METNVAADLLKVTLETNDWQQLADHNSPEFCQTWLALQCDLIAGTYAAMLVLRKEESGSFEPVAVWPDSKPDLALITEIVDQVIDQECGLITPFKSTLGTSRPRYGVAYPIKHQEQLLAVVAIAVEVDNKQALQQVMNQLQWGCAWVELSRSRQQNSQMRLLYSRLTGGMDLLAKILSEQTFDAAAMRLLSELAIAQQCELVSLGFIKGDTIRISHLSNSAQFGKKMNLLRRIEAAMNEAVDQQKVIILPQPSGSEKGIITLAHHNLAEQQQQKTWLTLPLYLNQRCLGAMSLQRDGNTPFSLNEAQYCESIAALAIVALEEKRLNSRPLLIKALEAGREQTSRLIGAGYLGRKLASGLLILLLIFFSTAEGLYRLSASASLKTIMQQVVVAPYDGFIQQAPVRAGDKVSKGDLLLGLDDGDLQLEKLKWISLRTKLSRQFQEETAAHNRANFNIINAQLAQADAQLKLVESQLQRSQQLAPFDGLVISGDLSQKLGGAVNKGDVLFEVSPLDAYRVYLQVKENRIADVQLGQTGTLYLSALPEISFPLMINKITPLTLSADGATFFTVEAKLLTHSDQFLPGMEGIGNIDIDKRKLWSIWTRELVEWLRLLFWSWWG